MAPRARVAMYKACWNDEGCAGTDLVAAIDAAVADGVDVINYSIGSDTPSLFTADGVSFLFADDAGVYVATSAGNAGPGASTVGSPAAAAWVTTVGASTHSRTFQGAVSLGDGSTFAVRPVALASPDEVTGTGTSGETTFDITYGYTGKLATEVHGLVPATTVNDNVVDDPANDINFALQTGVGINVHQFTVDPGTRHLRLSLFDEFTDGADDIDLYLFDCTDPDQGCVNVDSSGSGTSAEQVDVSNPAAGDWQIVVHGWQTDGPAANYTLFRWNLGDADAGNLTASDPGDATLGASATVDITWSGLTAGTRYLGAISYSDGVDEIDRTLVSIVS